MSVLSLSQLVELAQRYGFSNPSLAAAVAMAESGGNAGALNDTSGRTTFPPGIGPEKSIGLWQINVLANPKYAGWSLTDPDVNAKAALEMSNGGTKWTPWSTYLNGAYKKWLDAAAAAIGGTFVPLVGLSAGVFALTALAGLAAGAAAYLAITPPATARRRAA